MIHSIQRFARGFIAVGGKIRGIGLNTVWFGYDGTILGTITQTRVIAADIGISNMWRKICTVYEHNRLACERVHGSTLDDRLPQFVFASSNSG